MLAVAFFAAPACARFGAAEFWAGAFTGLGGLNCDPLRRELSAFAVLGGMAVSLCRSNWWGACFLGCVCGSHSSRVSARANHALSHDLRHPTKNMQCSITFHNFGSSYHWWDSTLMQCNIGWMDVFAVSEAETADPHLSDPVQTTLRLQMGSRLKEESGGSDNNPSTVISRWHDGLHLTEAGNPTANPSRLGVPRSVKLTLLKLSCSFSPALD